MKLHDLKDKTITVEANPASYPEGYNFCVRGKLESPTDEGEWYCRVSDDYYGACGVGFREEHVAEILATEIPTIVLK